MPNPDPCPKPLHASPLLLPPPPARAVAGLDGHDWGRQGSPSTCSCWAVRLAASLRSSIPGRPLPCWPGCRPARRAETGDGDREAAGPAEPSGAAGASTQRGTGGSGGGPTATPEPAWPLRRAGRPGGWRVVVHRSEVGAGAGGGAGGCGPAGRSAGRWPTPSGSRAGPAQHLHGWTRTLRRPQAIFLYSTPVLRSLARLVASRFTALDRALYRWQVGRFINDPVVRGELVPLLYSGFRPARPAFWVAQRRPARDGPLRRRMLPKLRGSAGRCGSSSGLPTRT